MRGSNLRRSGRPPEKRGWISYYGRFYPSVLVPSLNRINDYLVRWIVRKYKRYRGKWMRARDALQSRSALPQDVRPLAVRQAGPSGTRRI